VERKIEEEMKEMQQEEPKSLGLGEDGLKKYHCLPYKYH